MVYNFGFCIKKETKIFKGFLTNKLGGLVLDIGRSKSFMGKIKLIEKEDGLLIQYI